MTCDCITWARDPSLTNGVLTKHHPNCPKFEGKKKFMRITLHGGGTYIQPIDQLHNAFDGDLDGAEPGDKWSLELVEMYQEEVDALPDFQGH
ncbi:MAG: hypothetical protein KZQ99_04660 [Candidatus Thiodiazotropha sp. (ex Dulcina madagascariensis)]|nr:hypothetical protein [Candidatus Thiodiazotropha sp. (ex Dulcina madagascariensis)]